MLNQLPHLSQAVTDRPSATITAIFMRLCTQKLR